MRRYLAFVLLGALALSCKAGGCAANVLGDVVGETGDAYCDRRFVANLSKEPGSFCQEIIDTVAVSQFTDDCREKFAAKADEGRCPRERIIAGCKIHKENDDGSEIWDWYYDVSDLEKTCIEGRDAGSDAGPLFKEAVKTKEEVKALCADKKRYEEGATFVDVPTPASKDASVDAAVGDQDGGIDPRG
jgi:hypothetical protein